MKDLVIFGAGGFANGDLTWLIEDINSEKKQWNILGYIDDDVNNHGKIINTYEVLGGLEWLSKRNSIHCVIGIGNGKIRKMVAEKIKHYIIDFPSLIHPSVIKSKHIVIGQGCMICAGSLISGGVSIGDQVIINLDCTIGHDVTLENYTTIAPGAHLSGFVKVEQFGDIGTGTSIIQGLTIGENTVTGAGAVVIKDIPPNCTAVGVPAKVVRDRGAEG